MDTEGATAAQGMASERLECERALRELRQDIGCTKERLVRYPSLIGAIQRRLRSHGKPTTTEACVSELMDLARSLTDPKHRVPLTVALRFDPRYQEETLTDRRRHYNEDGRTDRRDVDLRTLERRENLGISALVQLLLEDETAAGLNGESLRVPRPSRARVLQATAREFWYTFGPNRVVRDGLIAVELVALEPGEHSYRVHSEYYADRRPGVVDIEPAFGCEVDGEPVFDDDRTYVRLRLQCRLEKGDRHSLVYRVRVHTDKPCRPVLMTVVANDEARMAKHIQFHPDAVPQDVWSFSDLPLPATYSPESANQRLISNAQSRNVGDSWRDLKVGLCYGLTWTWPTTPPQ